MTKLSTSVLPNQMLILKFRLIQIKADVQQVLHTQGFKYEHKYAAYSQRRLKCWLPTFIVFYLHIPVCYFCLSSLALQFMFGHCKWTNGMTIVT